MSNIVESMKQKKGFYSMGGVSEKQIIDAELKLELKFSGDYRQYVSAYGEASFYGHELTGVCSVAPLNVVAITIEERKFSDNIPDNWYVIEQTHIDGIVIWQSEEGDIYQAAPNTKPIKIFDSFMEYVNS